MPELSNEEASRRQGYWRKNLQYLAILLVIWFVVSYGCAILFVDYLDQWEMFGFNLGFWYAQPGAMICLCCPDLCLRLADESSGPEIRHA
tara:strand:+ start:274 stop:543 length:270 start_codon:yes stop_codon:yes gene_type:complete